MKKSKLGKKSGSETLPLIEIQLAFQPDSQGGIYVDSFVWSRILLCDLYYSSVFVFVIDLLKIEGSRGSKRAKRGKKENI